MASTSARVAARARARAAQHRVLTARADRDRANVSSLTDYFAAADEIEAATSRQARALADIREREGTIRAVAELTGLTAGKVRALLARTDIAADSDFGHEAQSSGTTPDGAALPAPGGATSPPPLLDVSASQSSR